MNITVEQGNIALATADTIIINLFEDVVTPGGATGAVDQALNGAISELIAQGDLTGKAQEVGVFYPRGTIPAKRVLIVGLGKREAFNLAGAKKAAKAAILRAQQLNSKQAATIVHGAGIAGLPVQMAAQATAVASLLALYHFDANQHDGLAGVEPIQTLSIVEYEAQKLLDIEEGVRVATAVAQGTTLARDLVNMPPNKATPTHVAAQAQMIANEHNLGITIGDRAWATERNMGAYLSVTKGAGESPRFVILEHNIDREDLDTIVLVGKGITFDTGGISLKPSLNMGDMKADMGGAAAVLGAMKAAAALNLPLRLIGITPLTENMPDANASRPSDVVTASNGKTIEIINTDAEGRLVLADALVYAGRYQPKAVIDLATLTGSSQIALGKGIAASLFSTDDNLRDQLLAASESSNEKVWPMPLWEEYLSRIRSPIADVANTGGRFGGVGTSALFLQQFTDYTWAHLDIAGMALRFRDNLRSLPEATGYGVSLLVEFLRNWS